jgi:hypothetical protein
MKSILITRLSKSRAVDDRLANDPCADRGNEIISTIRALREVVSAHVPPGQGPTSQSLFQKEVDVSPQKTKILQSYAEVWELHPSKELLIVDEMSKSNNSKSARFDISTLARLLQQAKPFTFGVLRCEKVYRTTKDGVVECRFAFNIPRDMEEPHIVKNHYLEG